MYTTLLVKTYQPFEYIHFTQLFRRIVETVTLIIITLQCFLTAPLRKSSQFIPIFDLESEPSVQKTNSKECPGTRLHNIGLGFRQGIALIGR